MSHVPEKILTKFEVDAIIYERKNEQEEALKAPRLWGLFFVLMSSLSFYALRSYQQEWAFTLKIFITFFLLFGLICLFIDLTLKVVGHSHLFYKEYLPAEPSLAYNCEAFTQMPKMEVWKRYVEEVKSHNRSLTQKECEMIMNAWNKLTPQ